MANNTEIDNLIAINNKLDYISNMISEQNSSLKLHTKILRSIEKLTETALHALKTIYFLISPYKQQDIAKENIGFSGTIAKVNVDIGLLRLSFPIEQNDTISLFATSYYCSHGYFKKVKPEWIDCKFIEIANHEKFGIVFHANHSKFGDVYSKRISTNLKYIDKRLCDSKKSYFEIKDIAIEFNDKQDVLELV